MNINEAMGKIDLIKGSIEDAKIHYKGMYLMCFLLSGLYMIQFIATMVKFLFRNFPINLLLVFYVMVEGMALLGYFFIIKKEKNFSNKYYLSLLSIWGFISFVIPIIVSAVNLIGEVFFKESYEIISASANFEILGFSQILLFSIFMIIISYIMNKKYFRVMSVLILFGYYFLYVCFFSKGIPLSFVSNQEQIGIGYVTIYTVLVVYLGYFIMGVYLKCKEGKEQKNEYK